MLSGVLTSDSLTQAFRSLSQKRRHGVLDIASPSGQVLIFFYNGKIIGAQSPECPFVDAICDKLTVAGAISSDLCDTLKQTVQNVSELSSVLVGRDIVSAEQFSRAKSAYEMDILYSLRKVQGGVFKFNSKIVELDDGLALSVAPGQLLLDMVELDAAEGRLEKDLRAPIASEVCVVPVGPAATDLSDDEAEVWRTLEITQCVKEIRDRALLSEYQLTEALLGLLERRLVAPSPVGRRLADGSSNLGQNPLGHMLNEIERPVATQPVEGSRMKLNALIDEAASMLESELDGLQFRGECNLEEENGESSQEGCESDESENDLVEADTATPVGGLLAPDSEMQEDAEIVAQPDGRSRRHAEAPQAVVIVPLEHRWSVREFLCMSNVRLLDDNILSKVTLLMTIVFLLALGWVGPRMVDRWLHAVEVFSSVK